MTVWSVKVVWTVFFLCRKEAAKGNKNKTKKPTEVPVPGNVLVQRPKDCVQYLDGWMEIQKQGKSPRV